MRKQGARALAQRNSRRVRSLPAELERRLSSYALAASAAGAVMLATAQPAKAKIGRALTDEKKARLLLMAASRSDWQAAYYAAVLALNTTARGCELKGLRWCDVNLIDAAMTIRQSKTEAGERVIPLNREAKGALVALYRRAKRIGSIEGDHYVFFACEHGHVDPLKPSD
jgi:integrase